MAKALALLQSNGHLGVQINTGYKLPTCSSFSRKSVFVRACSSNNHGPCYYLESINGHIDAHLNEAIPIRPPLPVYEPLHHLTLEAPRSTAPALCVAACELVGGNRNPRAVAAAAAIHLIHASFYIHEQLRLDGSNPKPANQFPFGPNIKLLIGDGMMPFGLEMLANSDDSAENDSERILRVIIELTRVAGSHGMIQEKYHEIVLNHLANKIGFNENWIDYAPEKKEGSLHACAAACGAILGGGNEDEIEKLRNFGHFVGMIQGIMDMSTLRKEKHYLTLVEEMRNLALKELEAFRTTKVELISSFAHPNTG